MQALRNVVNRSGKIAQTIFDQLDRRIRPADKQSGDRGQGIRGEGGKHEGDRRPRVRGARIMEHAKVSTDIFVHIV